MAKKVEKELSELAPDYDNDGGSPAKATNQETQEKKPFHQPRVTKHGSLPKVTGQGFVGTFSP